MATVLSPAEADASTRMLNIAAALIIALAFGAPFLISPIGIVEPSAAGVGEDMGRTFGSLCGLAFVAWLVTLKRNPRGKAIGRVVIGVLLCLLVTQRVISHNTEVRQGKEFVRAMMDYRQKQVAKFENLQSQLNEINLNTLLTPDGLISGAARAQARVKLQQFRVLLAERMDLLKSSEQDSVAFIKNTAPAAMQAGALKGFAEGKGDATTAYTELNSAQVDVSQAIAEILDWGEAQGSQLAVVNGHFVFTTDDQEPRLRALLAKLATAESRQSRAANLLQAAYLKSQKSMQEAEQLSK